MRAYHLTGPRLRDGRPIPAIGETLVHEGPIVMCESGLYASRRLLDALSYEPPNVTWIHEVDVEDIVCVHRDKLAARRRTIRRSVPFDVARVRRLAEDAASLTAWFASTPGVRNEGCADIEVAIYADAAAASVSLGVNSAFYAACTAHAAAYASAPSLLTAREYALAAHAHALETLEARAVALLLDGAR